MTSWVGQKYTGDLLAFFLKKIPLQRQKFQLMIIKIHLFTGITNLIECYSVFCLFAYFDPYVFIYLYPAFQVKNLAGLALSLPLSLLCALSPAPSSPQSQCLQFTCPSHGRHSPVLSCRSPPCLFPTLCSLGHCSTASVTRSLPWRWCSISKLASISKAIIDKDQPKFPFYKQAF